MHQNRVASLCLSMKCVVYFSMLCLAGMSMAQEQASFEPISKLPREIIAATVSSDGIRAKDVSERVEAILQRMDEVANQQPDLICLPELFAQIQITESADKLRETAAESDTLIVAPISKFAAEHRCFVVCSV